MKLKFVLVIASPPHIKKTEPVGSACSLCGAATKHLTCEALPAAEEIAPCQKRRDLQRLS